jgi:hypothetical protein
VDNEMLKSLDVRLRAFSTPLKNDLGIAPPESDMLATTINKEMCGIDLTKLPTLVGETPLSLGDRFQMLMSFFSWWNVCPEPKGASNIGHIAAMNYMCFVFLGEACFKALRKELPSGSVGQKCCVYLTDNPIRAFRNALAHGNWRPRLDHSGIDFWARKGSDPSEKMTRFRVDIETMNFWIFLSATTAYASLSAL